MTTEKTARIRHVPSLGGWQTTQVAKLRPSALFLAIALYGAASFPAPQVIGWAEAGVGALLLASLAPTARGPVGDRLPASAGSQWSQSPWPQRWRDAALLGALWLFTIPVLVGALAGHALEDMVRDVVPLGFLFLPVALLDRVRSDRAARLGFVSAIDAGLCVAGFAFGLRWWSANGFAVGAIGVLPLPGGEAPLLTAAAVLYAAVRLPAAALRLWNGSRFALAIITGGGGGLVALGLLANVHRAPLLLCAVAWMAIALTSPAHRPPMRMILAVVLILVIAGLADPGLSALRMLADKTDAVGLNMRAEEFSAVLDLVTRSGFSLLFGVGWGALVPNPAVGGDWVSFVHSFTAYFVLKTGLLGTAILFGWLSQLVPILANAVRRSPSRAFACLAVLANGFLVHTSFKYLCFGLSLSLLVLIGDED